MEMNTLNACLVTILCIFATCHLNSVQGATCPGLNLVTECCESKPYNPLNQFCCNNSIQTRKSAQERCCGKETYDMRTHTCFNKTLKHKNPACGNQTIDKNTQVCSEELEVKNTINTCFDEPPSIQCSILQCGSKTYKKSDLNTCCGEDVYSLSDNSVLCCNGILHLNVSEDSECVGGVLYTTANKTSFSQISCGSKVYNPHNTTLRCCSGHLYDTTHCDQKAECCETLLMKNKTTHTCCSSASQTLLYKTLPNHSCCGHYYYNTSLWSCCAERLKPTPEKRISPAHRLKPVMDLIPDICNKSVLFGKVEHLVLQNDKRHIMLRVVVVANMKLVKAVEDPLLLVSLDHCRSPALENGMTYLWEKNNTEYKPLSVAVDPVFDINMFFTVCFEKPVFVNVKAYSLNFCT